VNNQLDLVDLDKEKTFNFPLFNKKILTQQHDMVVQVELMNN
jgi:hypothetical protein